MAKQDISVSKRIARDRGGAGFWAFIASLPAVAAIVGLLYVGVRIVTDADADDFSGPAGFIWVGAIALFAFLFYVVARWTHDSVHAALTPQRVQAMWLRRFQAESGGAFRTSRVIDRLSRHGVAALTLQDRDVQLSFEQRRNRLAPIFWLLFIPVGLLIGYAIWNGWQDAQADIMNLPPAQDLRTGIGQAIGAALGVAIIAILLIIGFFAAILLTMIAVMLIAAIIGPIGAAMSKNRDDFKSLPRLLERIKRGRGRRGASIVRVSDANWREAVSSSLAAVDVAIIDLSNVSEHVAWEIAEAARACSASGLVFICRDDAELSDAAKLAVRNALGREMIGVVHYPAQRGASDAAFARDLRQQIYNAADLREATRRT